MGRFGILLLACCAVLITAPVSAASDAILQVPLRFHIVTDLVMQKNGVTMDNPITPRDIERILLPVINATWAGARIQFTLERIVQTPSLRPPQRDRLIAAIVDAKRNDSGKSDPKRIRQLNKLVDDRQHHSDAINIYLVPYLGQASQGNARPAERRIYVGVWTDKYQRSGSPRPVKLDEPRPFQQGSLGRTLAHEIGHILGLKHPDKKSQTRFSRLMGGKRPGYDLTSEEITIARQHAMQF